MLPRVDQEHLAALLILSEAALLALFLKSERIRHFADVLCCALMGAYVHFLLLQFGRMSSGEWEILSASVLVLSFSLMGWSLNHGPEKSDLTEQSLESLVTRKEPADEVNLHEERLKMLGAMSARFVHEMSQPLSILLLKIKNIEKSIDDNDLKGVKRSLSTLENQVQNILQLSNTMKHFSAGHRQTESGFVAVNDIFQFVCEMCEIWMGDSEVRLHLPESCPQIEVAGGRTLHVQVLLNLIKNSVDAVSELPEKEEKWVKVEIQERGGCVEFAVSNSGPTISKSRQMNLFRPFYSTKKSGKGMGLGLAISKDLVESVGGEIWYDEKAKSPRFVVRYSFLPSVSADILESSEQNALTSVRQVA